jgi:hypothetical protein
MAIVVREIMNREVLAFPTDLGRERALVTLLACDLSAAPVID